MKNISVRNAVTIGVLGTITLGAIAQGAPGVDPVQLTTPVRHSLLPGAPAPKSGQIDRVNEMPAWLKARVARFEAKAFSATADDGTISTDNDVVNTASAQGLRKSCVQEIGSNTLAANSSVGAGRGTSAGQQQIVVLRGDLVNICR